MSELEEQKLEVGLEQIVRQYMKDRLINVSDFKQEEDNSFAFLEKSTLQLLLASLLSGDKRVPVENGNGQFELSIVKQLDEMIEEMKVQFEEVMDLLKKLS
ncbi:hypothetical protein FC756_20905 [Lysinibacillus mangiferihumi]|uniref:Uncharacterized protein n=1 Tax=Lysinibacillus mangiferihumi TaxID=1130819 RepID=A0A4U2YF34_9BACI|nr:hypothetical protein [Lysinibacillus mangiferihumi]TKI59479.1 hypothetical protein FC756_20905 [Lysinibacillus mangiferihumi]